MNSQRRQFLRHKATCRPRLEHLERRDCPSCTVFQKGDTLTMLGDRLDNHIDIASVREGDGSVRVACDGSVRTFTGVKLIDLKAGGGDDEITANFSLDEGPEEFQFRADLGAGNDKLTISGFDPQPDPPLRSVAFDVHAGAGDDEIAATFFFLPANTPGGITLPGDDIAGVDFTPPDPNFHFRADLGAGNDRLSVLLNRDEGPEEINSDEGPEETDPLERARTVVFEIDAGVGDDTIAARFACPSDPTNFQFSAGLGDGNDKLSISGFDPQPDPPLASVEFEIRAGEGDDEVRFDLGSAEINGPFVVSVHGGLGNDRFSFGGIVPCILPEGELRIGLDGGAGDDLIDVAVTGLEIEGGLLVVDVSGGIGNDHLIVAMDPCFLPAGEVRIGVLGGAGGDLLEMSLRGLENEGGRFALEAAGGIGNDRLVLRAVDPCMVPESETRIALLGNDGDDRIDVTLMNAEIEGLFNLAVLGGAGNDILDGFIVPCVLPAGRANLLFDGDAGNDRIAARVEMDADSRGALAAGVFGGLGDDDLTLAVFGADELALLMALVDGGREHDIARVTRNVRVVNCEEVIFLDEPR